MFESIGFVDKENTTQTNKTPAHTYINPNTINTKHLFSKVMDMSVDMQNILWTTQLFMN